MLVEATHVLIHTPVHVHVHNECGVHAYSLHCPLPSPYSADIADCQTSVFHKASDKTEVGLSTRYNLQTSNVSLGLATKYTLNDGAILKVGVIESRLMHSYM